jgi:transposase
MIDILDSIFVCTHCVDMRKSIDGLSMLISDCSQTASLSSSAFVFINRAKDKIKILVKERNGYCLLYKRLDRGCFKINLTSTIPLTISKQQLRWLLDGLDYKALNPLKSPAYTVTF